MPCLYPWYLYLKNINNIFFSSGDRPRRRPSVIVRQDEPSAPRIPCARSKNEYTISVECFRKPKVPQRYCRHILHRWEPAAISVATESKPSAKIAKLHRLGPGERSEHAVSYSTQTGRHQTAYSANCFRYMIDYQQIVGNKGLTRAKLTSGFTQVTIHCTSVIQNRLKIWTS